MHSVCGPFKSARGFHLSESKIQILNTLPCICLLLKTAQFWLTFSNIFHQSLLSRKQGTVFSSLSFKIETVEFRCLQEWRISTKSSVHMQAGLWSCFLGQWKAIINLNAAAWSLLGWEPQQHIASRDKKIRKNTVSTIKLEAMSEAQDLGKMVPGLKQLPAHWVDLGCSKGNWTSFP